MNDIKIKVFQARYNTAQKVLIALGAYAREIVWRSVKDADLQCLKDSEQDAKREMWACNYLDEQKQNLESRLEVPGLGEGHCKLWWIWEDSGRAPDMSSGLHDGEQSNICSPPVQSTYYLVYSSVTS